MPAYEFTAACHRFGMSDRSSALTAVGGMRFERQHLIALPTYDLVHRKIQGRRVQVTAYQKTLLTLSTHNRRPATDALAGGCLGSSGHSNNRGGCWVMSQSGPSWRGKW